MWLDDVSLKVEHAITASVSDLLRNRYTVLTAAGAEEALRHLESSDVALVISDQRMPKMTGAERLALVARSKPDITRILLKCPPESGTLSPAVSSRSSPSIAPYCSV